MTKKDRDRDRKAEAESRIEMDKQSKTYVGDCQGQDRFWEVA